MHVIVDGYGMFIGKHSERVQVKQNGEVISEAPLREIDQITLATRGAVLSTDLIEVCVKNGIQINFLDLSGRPLAKLSSPNLGGTVWTRRQQMEAFNTSTGTRLAKQFVRGKITNQLNLLKYFGKYRKKVNSPTYQELQVRCSHISSTLKEIGKVPDIPLNESRGKILSIEGRAGKEYWQAVRVLVSNKVKGFPGREHRGAADLLNGMLNYGYGILYSQVWGALLLAGLEPFAGFVHVDRPGKPSLVLDFIEEFRQPVVDHAIIASLGKSKEKDNQEVVGGSLPLSLRREIACNIEERLDAIFLYRGCKVSLRSIIQRQSRRLASALRGEDKYRPFIGGW